MVFGNSLSARILLPCDVDHEPSRNCSETLVQVSFSILGGLFGVDLPSENHQLE